MTPLAGCIRRYNSISLVWRIVIGMAIGLALGTSVSGLSWVSLLGDLFVGALKGLAPVLVFGLVSASLARGQDGVDRRFSLVIALYLLSTILAAAVAVVMSFLFTPTLELASQSDATGAPTSIGEAFASLLLTMTANPLDSIAQGRYIGILFWATLFGLALRKCASDSARETLGSFADALGLLTRWVVNFAPFGVLGLVYTNVSTNGASIFLTYGKLLLVLVGAMLISALVVNPALVALTLRTNPYPLVLRVLRESGVTAFFTRSSAANIPVNMSLCERLGLDKEMYAVSIPIGATINMNGAAVTIAIMSLAAAHTVGVHVSLVSALALSLIASLGACGAAGVAGGSLLLIPMACSLFNVSNDVAMQAVAVGFIVGVVQDSMETALNSSGDALFTATAEYFSWKKHGKSLPKFLGGQTETELK